MLLAIDLPTEACSPLSDFMGKALRWGFAHKVGKSDDFIVNYKLYGQVYGQRAAALS